MGFGKNKLMTLNVEARYQPLFNTTIALYNLDSLNELGFQVKQDGVSVPLSSVNVESYITLIAEDGSTVIDNLDFENEMEGILSYTVPAAFLKHTGKVRGEVHVTVNHTTNTVVLGEFDFEIKDSLANQVDGEMKLSYIRCFDELRQTIENRVAAIEEAIKNGQDYVTAIQNASADAKQTINSAVAGAKADIDAKVTTATTNLNKTATDATKAITDTAKSATDSVDADLKEFKDTVANNGFLKPSDVANYQKYALTGADGVAKRISGSDCNTLTELGFYYLPSPINQPSGWGGLYLLVIPGSVGNTTAYYKQIGFQYATGKMATRDRKSGAIGDTSLWTDWVVLETEIGSAQKVAAALMSSKAYSDAKFSDTGWLPLALLNGAIAYDTSNTPMYRMVTVNGVSVVYLRGAVKGITVPESVVIATLPSAIYSKMASDHSYVQNTTVDSGKAQFNRLSVKAVTGEITVEQTTKTSVNTGNWVPISTTIAL